MASLVGTVAVLHLIQTLVVATFLAPPVLATLAESDLGFEAASVGYFIAIGYLGMMAATTVSASFVARLGAMRISQIALFACAAGLVLPNIGWAVLLVPATLLLGIGLATPTPAASHILYQRAPAGRLSLVLGIKETAVPLGGTLAGAVLPSIALAFGWQAALGGLAVVCLVVAIALGPLRRAYDGDREPAPVAMASALDNLRLVLRRRELREVAFTAAAFGALQWCFSAFFVVYLVDDIGVALVAAGLAYSVAQGAGVAGRVLWGFAADRFTARRVLGAIGVVMALSAFALAAAGTGWPAALIVGVGGVLGLTAIGWNGVFLAEVARLAAPGEVARATGGAVFFLAATMAVAPAVFSLLVALTGGYATGFIVTGMLAGGRALGLLRRRPPDLPDLAIRPRPPR